ncbi:MAG: CS1-pili formation C-terminal domain-containing protein, partial [Burkholderiales bacterium]|nr:CS1-pili formation C-terminal domain-containing protein [Burkholderiales bacterium]
KVKINNADDANGSYQIEMDENSYNLYPGNVIDVSPAVKAMVTVFGRLTTAEGMPLPRAVIKNHIGETISDNDGNFSIDVDRHYPEVRVVSDDTGEFAVKMNLDNGESTAWMGNIIWQSRDIQTYHIQAVSNNE